MLLPLQGVNAMAIRNPSLALGYALVGLSARPAYQCLGCLLSVDFLESAILQKKIDIQQQRRFKQCVCGKFCHDS